MSRCKTQRPGRNPAARGGERSMDLPRPERLNQETQDRSLCCLCSAPKRRGVKHLEVERDFHQPSSPELSQGESRRQGSVPLGLEESRGHSVGVCCTVAAPHTDTRCACWDRHMNCHTQDASSSLNFRALLGKGSIK